MKGSQEDNTNSPIETTAEDKTLVSAWDFLPRPIIETLAKAGVVHLNDFIRLNRLSVMCLPLSYEDKGLVLQQRDLLLADYDKAFVPFPFNFGEGYEPYATLFRVMAIQLMLIERNTRNEANLAEQIALATIDVILSMFDSSSFFAEKSVFATIARPSVELAKDDGMIRLWEQALDDVASLSQMLSNDETRKIFDMANGLFSGYQFELERLNAPVAKNWYRPNHAEPFMQNLIAVTANTDDAEILEKAVHDVQLHIDDLKCYQFDLRIRELEIYSKAPLPLLSDKPIYNKVQLNFVKALKDFDKQHPNSVRSFSAAIEDIQTGKTDAPMAFHDKHGIDFTGFVRESMMMPMYIRFEHPAPHLAGTGYDGIDAQEPSPWHHKLREKFLDTLRGYFRKRAKAATKGSTVRRMWLNAEAELLAYQSEYFNRTDDEDEFKAPQKVIDAANAAAREEWIAKIDEDCETAAPTSGPIKPRVCDYDAPVTIATGVVMKNGRFRAMTKEELAFPQTTPTLANFQLLVNSIGKVEPPKENEEAARRAALSDVPELLKDMGNQLARIEKLGQKTKKLVVRVKNKVDPFDRYDGLEKVSEARRPLIHAAIDYCYKQAIVIVPIGGKPKEGQLRLSDFANVVWNLPESKNNQAGFSGLKDFQTALNEQAHRNERSFIWAAKEQ